MLRNPFFGNKKRYRITKEHIGFLLHSFIQIIPSLVKQDFHSPT